MKFISALLLLSSGVSQAIPPKPLHSREAPWMTPLSEDRTKEFTIRQSNGQKIIVDTVLGHEWAGTVPGNSTWYESHNYCDDSTYGGYSDWRLPTYWEMITIQKKYAKERGIYPIFSHLDGKMAIWSSDDSVNIDQPDWDDRWVLFVDLGLVTFEVINQRFSAQCIRGAIKPPAGPVGKERYKELQPDLIHDLKTNLLWTGPRNPKVSKTWLFTVIYNWYEANLWCDTLEFAGRTDWRLPRLDEISVIGDMSKPYLFSYMPKIPNTGLGFWTSSPAINPIGPANWTTDLVGSSYPQSKEEDRLFGCVHSN